MQAIKDIFGGLALLAFFAVAFAAAHYAGVR